MAPGLKYATLLEPEKCWKLWNELGSLRKVKAKLRSEGVVNPRTGEPPTSSAIEKAAFMWLINNPQEARKDAEYSWRREGKIMTDADFNDLLYNAARMTFYQRPGRWYEWLSKMGLEEK